MKKTKMNKEQNVVSTLELRKAINYEHLLALEWIDDQELLAVILNPITLLEQLPPAFRHKLFGVS